MNDLFVGLLPLILGATLAPVYPIVVLLLLQSERGLVKAAVFVTGAVAARLSQGVLFGFVFVPAVDAESAAGLKLISPVLLTVVGVLLLVMGVKKWRKESTEDDGDEPPGWIVALTEMSPLKAAGGGLLLILVSVKQWVFTLAAISVIAEAQLGIVAGSGLYVLYTLATQVLVLPPILVFAVAPQKTAIPLNTAQVCLQRHNRVIVMVVSLVFGFYFLYRGVAGLLVFRGM